jgi:DNA-binding response OmpR family regulator
MDIKLTATEYRILEYFMAHPNRLITRSMIEENAEASGGSNTIDVLIKTLRQKLGWSPETGPLRTLRGSGYKLTL